MYVLFRVGEDIADNVSILRLVLAPLPNVRGAVEVLTESLGRCGAGPRCKIGRAAVILSEYAGDEVMVESIMGGRKSSWMRHWAEDMDIVLAAANDLGMCGRQMNKSIQVQDSSRSLLKERTPR